MNAARAILTGWAIFTAAYFVTLNTGYLVFTAVAGRELGRALHRRRYSDLSELFAYPFAPGITVILPAFNEAAGIIESVRSLLALRYPRHEVVVVNDGSTDDTLGRLTAEFDLVPVCRAIRTTIATQPVRGTYVARQHHNLWVIDKENGGKADALNAGISAAQHDYICVVDADAMLEAEALLQVAAPIMNDPDLVVATGGIVRIANGCTIDHGRVTEIRLPASRLAVLQVIEYFRAFLVGRVAWTRLNALFIISGAFGLFRRATVEEVGAYWTGTVGEDAELVVRIHRRLRARGQPYRMIFIPEPVCWTEAPETFAMLARQRRRWHQGLGQALWRHRRMTANRRGGLFGLLAFPYFLLFEFLGPLIELAGLPATIAAFALGYLSVPFFLTFLLVAVLLGICFSVAAVMLEEFSFSRHSRGRDVARMLGYAVLENLGYRQLTDLWRTLGLLDLLRGKHQWGRQDRRGIGKPGGPAPGARDAGAGSRGDAMVPAQSPGSSPVAGAPSRR